MSGVRWPRTVDPYVAAMLATVGFAERTAGARHRRHDRRVGDDRGHRPAVLLVRRPDLTTGSVGRRCPLAAAPRGAGWQRSRSSRRTGCSWACSPRTAGSPAVPRGAVPVCGALDRAERDRTRLDRRRQRAGRDLQRLVLQHHRDRADPAAGRMDDERRRRRRAVRGRVRRHRGTAAATVRGRAAGTAVDRRLDEAAQDAVDARRPRLDPARRLHRLQRGRGRRHVAPGRPGRSAGARRRRGGPARRGPAYPGIPAFRQADKVAIVFCGSTKSAAVGLPWPACCSPAQPPACSYCR